MSRPSTRSNRESIPGSSQEIVLRSRSRSTPPSAGYKRKSHVAGDSGIEIQVFETKSCENVRKQRQLFCSKLSRQSLYKEALYTATHMLGKPSARFPATQEDILTYVQVTFAKDAQEQIQFIEQVTAEPFPLTIVNVGIVRAENLVARDKNGLSDPYCLISVETEESIVLFQMTKAAWRQVDFGSPQKPKIVRIPKDRERAVAEKRFDQVYGTVPKSIRTSIQHQTLNPVWEERFQCLALRPSQDILHIEVWDHDDEEEVVHSLQGATDSRRTEKVEAGMEILAEGFRRGKRDDFIGQATHKISEIPVEGKEEWFYLEGKTHRGAEAQGKILAQIWLTHGYRHGVHYTPEAHPRVVLEKLWDYVLDVEAKKKSVAGEPWDSTIPAAASCLLFQYGLQTGLSEASQAIIRFNAYAKRHLEIHGTELKELDCSMQKFEGWSPESVQGKVDHCDRTEMLSSLLKTLQGPYLVLRNHFHERRANVDQALGTIRHVQSILSRMGATDQVEAVDTEVKVSLRFGIQQWYQETRKEFVRGPPDQTHAQVICGLAQVMGVVNRKLSEGQKSLHGVFAMEGNVDYLPLLYDEFQKAVVNDIEGATAGLDKEIGDNDAQRKILLRISPEHKALCVCFFELYAETHRFVYFQDQVFAQSLGMRKFYPHLDTFHEWFRPVLILWLGFAFIKAHQMISVSIDSDEIDVDGKKFISHSALETVFVFHQLANFAKELNWPDPVENSVINMFLLEVMTYISILYAKLKRRKIDREGYFDTVGQFDISERLCTSLNNIHYVQETVRKMPTELLMDTLLEGLKQSVGDKTETLDTCHRRIVMSIITAVNEIESEIQIIMAGIAHRIRPEIRAAWNDVVLFFESNPGSDDPLGPLVTYLENNLSVLHQYLLHPNFVRLVHVIWLVTCDELVEAVVHVPVTSTVAQQVYFGHFQNLVPLLVEYLKGNGEGLNDNHLELPQFKFAQKLLHLFVLPSEQLIAEYFHDRAAEQLELKGRGLYGTLRLRIFAVERKLQIEVISGKNLLPLDHPSPFWDVCSKVRSGSSDPFVEIELLVEGHTVGSIRKTKTHKHTLNPTFGETFEFYWDKIGLESWTNVIVRFTIKDFDLLSANDFMGEILVPLGQMPGVATEKLQPQPMTLQLREGGNPAKNPYLMVLNSRQWEVDTKTFVLDQLKRQICPYC